MLRRDNTTRRTMACSMYACSMYACSMYACSMYACSMYACSMAYIWAVVAVDIALCADAVEEIHTSETDAATTVAHHQLAKHKQEAPATHLINVADAQDLTWGIMFHAGSSGTRLKVFKWPTPDSHETVPVLQEVVPRTFHRT